MCLPIEIAHPENVLAKGEHRGFEWVIVHNGIGHRCGYVRVPKGHAWHGKGYYDISPDVHGGLTFAQADEPCDKAGADDAWWVGFDCAHAGDAPDPSLPANRYPGQHSHRDGFHSDTIKDTNYVMAECQRLCEQAAAA